MNVPLRGEGGGGAHRILYRSRISHISPPSKCTTDDASESHFLSLSLLFDHLLSRHQFDEEWSDMSKEEHNGQSMLCLKFTFEKYALRASAQLNNLHFAPLSLLLSPVCLPQFNGRQASVGSTYATLCAEITP